MRPLIDTRLMWQDEKREPGYNHSEPILRPLHPERVDTILYSERGEVVCRCPRSAELRPMAYQRFEADRNTLKYRCPAAAYDLDCKGREACLSDSGSKAGSYGRIVRVNLEGANRRIFTPTPWGSPSWKRLPPPQRAGADQCPARPGVRLRGALHPGHGEDADSGLAGLGGDDGDGAGEHPDRPESPHAFAGAAVRVRRHRIAPDRFPPSGWPRSAGAAPRPLVRGRPDSGLESLKTSEKPVTGTKCQGTAGLDRAHAPLLAIAAPEKIRQRKSLIMCNVCIVGHMYA